MPENLCLCYPPGMAQWILHPPFDRWGDRYILAVPVELLDDGLSARNTIKLAWPTTGSEPDLVGFLDDVADGWEGWTGERTWHSLDSALGISARHDGRGHVTFDIALRRDAFSEGAWSARVSITVEAGEQMRQLAADVRAHLEQAGR